MSEKATCQIDAMWYIYTPEDPFSLVKYDGTQSNQLQQFCNNTE